MPEHAEKAFTDGAQIYLASIAKSAGGVAKAFKHYPNMAKQYAMTVAMSNCVGPCHEAVGFQARKADQRTNLVFMGDKQGILLAVSELISGQHHDLVASTRICSRFKPIWANHRHAPGN